MSEVPRANYSQAVFYLLRATSECSKICNTLKPNGELGSTEITCLRKYIKKQKHFRIVNNKCLP